MSQAEFVSKSGTVKGKTNILKAMRDSVRDALAKSIVEVRNETLHTVARKTGKMRKGNYNRVKFKQYVVSQMTGKKRIELDSDDLRKILERGGMHYAKYHIRGPNLNPKFSGGYSLPSTPNTDPISPAKLIRKMNPKIRKRIKQELKKRGLETN